MKGVMKIMSSEKIEVICPCCETILKVDKKTGEIIWEEKKAKVMPSLADMVKEHEAHKKEQESLFNKRSKTQKDRSRLLEEKFKEAQKNVDKSKDIPLRDIDLD
jgi:uncharacterized Zn finger protein (UPF0148 family)